MNLLVAVAVLLECELEKLQLFVKAVLAAKSSGSLCQGEKHSLLLVEWLVVGPGVWVKVGMSGIAVCLITQRVIRSPVHISIQEGKVSISRYIW